MNERNTLAFKSPSINVRYLQLVELLARQHIVFLTMLYVLITLVVQLILLVIFPVNQEHYAANYPLWKRLSLNLIIGPIAETIIFQILILQLILNMTKGVASLAVLISAICFGLWHDVDLTNMLNGFVAGLGLGTLYFVLQSKKRSKFLYITIAHSAFNLSATIINAFVP